MSRAARPWARLLAWLASLIPDQAAQPATRVGLLNTGELVLMLDGDHPLVISAATVDAIRTTLASKASPPPPQHWPPLPTAGP